MTKYYSGQHLLWHFMDFFGPANLLHPLVQPLTLQPISHAEISPSPMIQCSYASRPPRQTNSSQSQLHCSLQPLTPPLAQCPPCASISPCTNHADKGPCLFYHRRNFSLARWFLRPSKSSLPQLVSHHHSLAATVFVSVQPPLPQPLDSRSGSSRHSAGGTVMPIRGTYALHKKPFSPWPLRWRATTKVGPNEVWYMHTH